MYIKSAPKWPAFEIAMELWPEESRAEATAMFAEQAENMRTYLTRNPVKPGTEEAGWVYALYLLPAFKRFGVNYSLYKDQNSKRVKDGGALHMRVALAFTELVGLRCSPRHIFPGKREQKQWEEVRQAELAKDAAHVREAMAKFNPGDDYDIIPPKNIPDPN